MASKALPSAAGSVCPIQRSLLTIAVLTLFRFTLPSLRFLRSSPEFLSPKVDEADVFGTLSSSDVSYSTIYHSPEVFFKGYADMEEKFKVFICPDGDPNTYFQTPRKLTGKYSSDGYFFQNIRESRFRTEDPDKADLFFVPVSCHKMRGKRISEENMTIIVQNYVGSLINKYPYWNRTHHFFVTCHDVGVRAFEGLQIAVKKIQFRLYVHQAMTLDTSHTGMSLFLKFCSLVFCQEEEMTSRTELYSGFGEELAHDLIREIGDELCVCVLFTPPLRFVAPKKFFELLIQALRFGIRFKMHELNLGINCQDLLDNCTEDFLYFALKFVL